MDCDEKEESIREKRAADWNSEESDDPYDEVVSILRREVPPEFWEEKGSIEIPGWLRPKPAGIHRGKLDVAEFAAFLDGDGCRRMAAEVEAFVRRRILPQAPCLVAVDHSMTGGVVRALADHHGRDALSLVILDSHTDALPMDVSAQAVQYDLDTNPATVHDRYDPFLYHRPDSYNASSFLHHLLEEGVLDPANLMLLGVSDFPDKRAMRIKDPRIRRYVEAFTSLKRMGVTVVTKKEVSASPARIRTLLKRIRTPWLYVSVDMDIGARNAVEGVRFRDRRGLPERQIVLLVETLRDVLSRDVRLAGMDVTEFNPRRAGKNHPSGCEPTYRIAADIIRMLAFDK